MKKRAHHVESSDKGMAEVQWTKEVFRVSEASASVDERIMANCMVLFRNVVILCGNCMAEVLVRSYCQAGCVAFARF
jgi:hypothetical protein